MPPRCGIRYGLKVYGHTSKFVIKLYREIWYGLRMWRHKLKISNLGWDCRIQQHMCHISFQSPKVCIRIFLSCGRIAKTLIPTDYICRVHILQNDETVVQLLLDITLFISKMGFHLLNWNNTSLTFIAFEVECIGGAFITCTTNYVWFTITLSCHILAIIVKWSNFRARTRLAWLCQSVTWKKQWD